MSVGYMLVNNTKNELVSFAHLPVNTKREIAGNPVSSAIVTWYLLENPGNDIAFVSDTYDDWPFRSGNQSDLIKYHDRTDDLITKLISEGILNDNGMDYVDDDDPENVFIRAIENVWLSK